MKLAAVKYHPRYIINRLRLTRLIKGRNEKYTESYDS